MARYIVCSSHMKASKVKGDFPEIFYTYIANDSHLSWHYTLTADREKAYIFDEFEWEDAEFIASCWGMQIKQLI
ncbi:hypothetical protein AF332_07025 [Sporosarcina globispora]|uniref:Uncharacterized protein n=1 Tax=Sporosarcina globispora TaxID=1459 RepID=A0A0M0G9T8_SPOGL|nr:hypothetical protein [Sporosarcina globispora]KON86594.1 hypothetical protein AF332_07025 [Sporosarcina globispora]